MLADGHSNDATTGTFANSLLKVPSAGIANVKFFNMAFRNKTVGKILTGLLE